MPSKPQQNSRRSLYEPLDFFMLRTPVLPLETLDDSGEDAFGNLKYRELIQEALAIASPSLLKTLRNSDHPRKRHKAQSSLRRYLLRMATRPTPFGLFAGFSWGTLGAQTAVELDDIAHSLKHVRPDQKWLLALVAFLEQRWDIVKNARVIRNPAILATPGRLVLPFFSGLGQQAEGKVTRDISIRATSASQAALELAMQSLSVQELVDKLRARFPETPVTKIQEFLHQLIQQEFLITSLRPPLTVDSPLDYLIEELQDNPEAQPEWTDLCNLKQAFATYEASQLGEGIKAQTALTERMREESALQVDLARQTRVATLPQEVAQELSRALEVLWRISPTPQRLPHLAAYHQEFLERYGSHREIPVLELLSPELGLGAPASYQGAPGYRKEPVSTLRNETRQALLCELAMTAVRDANREVQLTDRQVEQLASAPFEPTDAPDYAEIYAEILAKSAGAIDGGDYLAVIGPNPGTSEMGATFGRFLPFSEEPRMKMQALARRQEADYPEVQFVKASYLPPMGHWGNVAIAPCHYPQELALGTNPGGEAALSLEDVFVGATSDRLYLRSRTTGKELRFQVGQMLSLKHSPNVYRFLVEVSQEGTRGWGGFSWGSLAASPHLPRIRYGKTILSPALWNLSGIPLDESLWHTRIEDWRRRWNVPNLVYLLQGDQRILLDLSKPEHLDELRQACRQKNSVTLAEMVGDRQNRWVKGRDGHYVSEFVIPFRKRGEYRKHHPIPRHFAPDAPRAQRLKPPGSEWFYLKLHVPANREEGFLLDWLYPFAEKMLASGMAEQWHFLRYQDPEPHLRLRLKGNALQLFQESSAWAAPLLESGNLQQVAIETYHREFERYGGPDRTELAEAAFCTDSRLCCRLLAILQRRDFPWPPISLAAVSLLALMEAFGLSPNEQKHLLPRGEQTPHSLDPLCLAGSDLSGLQTLPYGVILRDALSGDLGTFTRYGKALESELKPVILKSLLHMHCNRLLGRERPLELQAQALARKILERKVRISK